MVFLKTEVKQPEEERININEAIVYAKTTQSGLGIPDKAGRIFLGTHASARHKRLNYFDACLLFLSI